MILNSWLVAVFGRLKASQSRLRGRRRRSFQTTTPRLVENLESRAMLATAPIVIGGSVTINETSEIFPYALNNQANGTQVFAVAVVDPDVAPDNYVPGNLAISLGNTDVNGQDGPAFGMAVIGGQDWIVINDTRDLNFEAVQSFTLVLTATDSGGAAATATVSISLRDLNDRPVIPQYAYDPINSYPSGGVNVLQVNENSFNGTIVGQVTAIDEDSGDQSTLTYGLVGTIPGFNAATPAFAIDPFTGKVRVTDSAFLDYEARRNGSGVANLGEGGLPGFADVVFDLRVRATDNRGIFSLSSRTDQDGRGTTTGDISDSHVYVRLRDVGEVPPDVSKSTQSMSLNENSPLNLSVGFFELKSGTTNYLPNSTRTARPGLDTFEPQQTHSFAIVGGNTNNAFAIDYTTGEVTVRTANINYEQLKTYNLQVQVTDQNAVAASLGAVDNVAPLSTVATLNINVLDINEPTNIPSGQRFSIPENTVNGTIVGSVIANDPDTQKPNGLGSLSYSIISGNTVKVNGVNFSSLFAIDSVTGVISVSNTTGLANNVALNFENQPSFSLTVRVVDRNDLSTSANNTVIVNLDNVNETPPRVQDDTFVIAENRPLNDLVGQVTAAVGEIGNSIVSYQILAGNTGGAFAIDTVGRITVSNPALIDYETRPQFTLTIKATDNGTPALFATGSITINVTNLNEQIVILDQSFRCNENTPNGTIIGQIVTRDPDNAVTQIQGQSFVINGGNTGGAFDIDAQGRIIVINSSALNYETTPSFTVITTVKDTGIPSTSMGATITISLVDINDAPVIGNQTFVVREHSLTGAVVGTVQATDEDLPAQTFSFAITGGDPTGAFSIDPNTAVITVTDPGLIDYATSPFFNLTVTVTDNGIPALSSSALVVINLLDVQDPQLPDQSISIFEHGAMGTVVTTATATNGVGPYAYSILSGNTSNAFAINAVTGVITVNNPDAMNLNRNPKFSLKLLVVDSQSTPLGDTAIITITLLNVNDPPVLIGLETTALNYIEKATTPVTATLIATDPDSDFAKSATIQITTGYRNDQDTLVFTNTAKVTGVWDPTTGRMTLTGIDTFTNYRAAIRSVAYRNTSPAPNTAKRTLSFVITDDGNLPSAAVTRDVTVNSTNDAPVLANGSSVNFIEADPAVIINPNITVTDLDNPTLSSATVTITNFVIGEDVLGFVNDGSTMGNIGIQSNANGVLTLVSAGATATLNQWQSALRVTTYLNSRGNPTTTTRTVNYQVNDGTTPSNIVTSTININSVNFPPALSNIEPGALVYNELATQIVSNTITVSDFDSVNLSGATVQITGNFQSNQDLLKFTNTSAITGSFNTSTGILTLTGRDTVANYQAALRSVTYSNSNQNPNTSVRTVTFIVSDETNVSSNSLLRNISINSVNDAPTLSGVEAITLQYFENTPPNYAVNNTTTVSQTIQANDPDSLLIGAAVQITGSYTWGHDFLRFTNTAKIKGTWDGPNGILTLVGSDTPENYSIALRSIAYYNQHDNPSTLTRTVTYTVTDDGTPNLSSNPVSREINVIAVNDPPRLTNTDPPVLNYTEDAVATPILPNVLVTDPDNNHLSSATIKVTSNYNANGSSDLLSFVNTAKITGSWDAVNGVLTLTGADTVSNYRSALRTVSFSNKNDGVTAPTRTVSFVVTDPLGLSGNTLTRDINMRTRANAAILSGIETTAGQYKANDPYTPSTPITSTLVATDYDSINQVTAVIKISNNYVSGQDQLVIDGAILRANQLYAAWNSATGELSLSGRTTTGNYLNGLRGVRYINTSPAANSATRTISFLLYDDTMGNPLPSNIVKRDIVVITTNVAPTLATNSSGPLAYTEKDPATVISPELTIIDADSPNMLRATIKITGNYQSGEDRLVFTNTPTIQGTWNAGTASLSLVGLDSQANYQEALRSIKYVNSSNNPNLLTRTVSYTVEDGLATSTVAIRDITLRAVNDPPVIATNANGALAYSPANGSVSIAPALSVTDADSPNMTTAIVQIMFNYLRNNDQLLFVDTAKIKGSFDLASGTLTLTGIDTIANYRAALQSVKYAFIGTAIASTKTVSFSVKDGVAFSNVATRDITITP